MAARRPPPRLVPLERLQPAEETLAVVSVGAPRLLLLRMVPTAFRAAVAPPHHHWLIGVRNEHESAEYTSEHVYTPPKKSKAPAWTPEELAVEAARKLNEYRGRVSLGEYKDGVCVFAALFVSNSLWTFCVWSTDATRCPPRKQWPDGWRPGQPFPKGLPRREVTAYPPPDCHHPDRDPAKFSKTAQTFLP